MSKYEHLELLLHHAEKMIDNDRGQWIATIKNGEYYISESRLPKEKIITFTGPNAESNQWFFALLTPELVSEMVKTMLDKGVSND